jgi:phosphoglycolate phosphatase
MDIYLFDLDGTIIDSGKDIAVAANYALTKLDKKPLPENEIIKHVGYGGHKLIEGILNTSDNEMIEKGVRYFREYYFSNLTTYSKPYPYVEEVLKDLKNKGKNLGVITNKYEDLSIQILKELNLLNFFDVVVGGDTTSEKKPNPMPVFHALEKINTDSKNAIIIGDSEADILAGKNAGIKTCLVTYGFGKLGIAKKYNPDFIINSFKEVKNLNF